MNDELPALMRRMTRTTFFFLSMGFLGMAIWPDYKPYFGGFLVGVVGGLLSSRHLAWKTNRIGEAAASGVKVRSGFGFLSRAAIGLAAAVVSVKLTFSPWGTVMGLFALPLATLLLGLVAIRRHHDGYSSGERGEKQ